MARSLHHPPVVMTDAQKAWWVECSLAGYVHLVESTVGETLCGFITFCPPPGNLCSYWNGRGLRDVSPRFLNNPCPRCHSAAIKVAIDSGRVYGRG